MLAAYGVDVLDPATTPRRVWVLLNNLPPSARRPGEPWSDEAALLAMLVDHLAELTWVTVKIANPKGNVTRPRPIPRPPRRPVIWVEDNGARPARDRNVSLPSPGRPAAPGTVKHSNWIAAIEALAGRRDVKVERGGADALRAP